MTLGELIAITEDNIRDLQSSAKRSNTVDNIIDKGKKLDTEMIKLNAFKYVQQMGILSGD